jgi:hypothetical protein
VKSWRHLAILGLFLLAGLIAYSNVINSWFLSDDFAQIGKVLNGERSVVWGREYGGFFRPLFILSYLIDTKIWGARPFGFHLTNVLVHSLNAFLVYILSLRAVAELRLTTSTKKMLSIGAGALFLLHPSHTEAVSWISGRADVLATCFSLASLLFYLAYSESKRTSQLALSLLSFIFGLMAKESAICLPFLIVAMGLLIVPRREGRTNPRRHLTVFSLYFSLLLAFVLVRYFFIGALVGGYGASQHLNFSPRWLRDRLLEAFVRSVLPVLPSQLSQFLFKPLQSRAFILFSLACLGLVAGVILLRRHRYGPAERREQNRFLSAVAILFLFSLLPVINLRLSLYQTLGERFLYLPTVFSCLLITYLAAILIRKQVLWISILICVLGFYSVRLYQTNRSWSEAAQLSRSIADELVDSATSDRLVVLNLPDNLRGVPVFHNGLPEALSYFQNRRRFTQIDIIAFQDLQSSGDEASLSSGTESLDLHLLNDNDSLVRMQSLECWETMTHARTFLKVHSQLCAADEDVFFFSKGSMTRLTER